MKCIVVNSSIIIALSKLGLLRLLTELYDKIIIPKYVYREVAITGIGRPGSEELKELNESKG